MFSSIDQITGFDTTHLEREMYQLQKWHDLLEELLRVQLSCREAEKEWVGAYFVPLLHVDGEKGSATIPPETYKEVLLSLWNQAYGKVIALEHESHKVLFEFPTSGSKQA